MMWMMAICCLGPIIIAFIVGRSGGRISNWWIFVLVALCLGAHLFMHRGHKHDDSPKGEEDKNSPDQLK